MHVIYTEVFPVSTILKLAAFHSYPSFFASIDKELSLSAGGGFFLYLVQSKLLVSPSLGHVPCDLSGKRGAQRHVVGN